MQLQMVLEIKQKLKRVHAAMQINEGWINAYRVLFYTVENKQI